MMRRLMRWVLLLAPILLIGGLWLRSRTTVDVASMILPGDFAVIIGHADSDVWLLTSRHTSFADGRRLVFRSTAEGAVIAENLTEAVRLAKTNAAETPLASERVGLLLGSVRQSVGTLRIHIGWLFAFASLPLVWAIGRRTSRFVYARLQEARHGHRTLCEGCGYDLRAQLGSDAAWCPECGRPVKASHKGR